MSVSQKIVADLVANNIEFITTVPCKQLAGVIDEVEASPEIHHIPSNKEDEGMGLCAGAWMGGKRPAIIMQNTAIGVSWSTRWHADAVLPNAAADADFLSRRAARAGGLSGRNGGAHQSAAEPAAYPDLSLPQGSRRGELDAILKYTFMCNKPVAILTDASFWGGYGDQ